MSATTCPACGAEVPEGFAFCGRCGARIEAMSARTSRKMMTALFCDVTGSTELGERTVAETVREVIGSFFGAMRGAIERHGGTVEKYIGDAVQAVFGIPTVHEDDAVRACRAALEMQAAAGALSGGLERDYGVALRCRIGVNSGEVVAGADQVAATGSTLASGDAINVAARLEQSAQPGQILIGQLTERLAREEVVVERVGDLSLKGKAEDVSAFLLLAMRGRPSAAAAIRLIGRAAELEMLSGTLDVATQRGSAEFVCVLGEAGVGKSRLVAAFAERCGAPVFTGRCPPYGDASTYQALAEVVTAAVGTPNGDLDDARRSLASMLGGSTEGQLAAASIEGLLGWSAPTRPEHEAPWAVARLLEHVAEVGPIVVVLEDLHRAERPLLDLLPAVVSIARAPMAMIATSRIDPGLGPAADLIALPPLTPSETGALARQILGARPVEPGLGDRIAEASGGNPLFVEELLSMWIDVGSLVEGADGWRLDEGAGTAAVPPTIQALFAARLDVLPAAERDVAERASIVGPVFSVEQLRAVDPDAEDPEGPLQELLGRGLMVPRGPAYGFRHGLARETAYGGMTKAVRADRHERFGRWLETRDDPAGVGVSDEAIAHHYEQAWRNGMALGRRDDRWRRLSDAAAVRLAAIGERDVRLGDRHAALGVVRRAAELLAHLETPTPEEADVCERLGHVAVSVASWPEAVGILDAVAGADRPSAARDLGVALTKTYRADPDGAPMQRGRDLLETAGVAGDAEAFAELAGTWKGVDDHKAETLYARAVAIDPSDPYALGNLLEYQVTRSGDLSPARAAREAITEAVQRCREQLTQGLNLPWAFYDLGKFTLLLGDGYGALEAYARAIRQSTASFQISTSLASLERLATSPASLEGVGWAIALLRLGAWAVFGEAPSELPTAPRVHAPVVVVAGGTDVTYRDHIDGYGPVLDAALEGFRGTVISGATADGVSGLVGAIGERATGRLETVGYLPSACGVPPDRRYHRIRLTTGEDFSPVEPLTYWGDILASHVAPADVTVLGLGGGKISAIEFRIALALGARVGIVAGSGRAADALLEDRDWLAVEGLRSLPADPELIAAMLEERTDARPGVAG